MKINYKLLIICILIPLAVGGLSALLTGSNMELFDTLNKPPLSPPGWLFGVVWTILYVLMGVASYLVISSEGESVDLALKAYALQLFFNFFWSIWFFNLSLYTFSFVWLVFLWAAILATVILFYRNSRTAARLMLPYLLWVSFAGYLNLAIAILN